MTWRTETLAEGVTLYQGDWRDMRYEIGGVDALISDPPYGIGWDYDTHVDGREPWELLISDTIEWGSRHAKKMALAIGSSMEREAYIYNHQLRPKWRICHYKGSTGARCPVGFRNWEMVFVWGSGFGNGEKLSDFFQTPPAESINYGHPCEKQLEWAEWLVSRLTKPANLVFDPFLGSGTTAVASIKLGRRFVGAEISPKYFDIACKRISDALKRPDFFVERPAPAKQEVMPL